MDPSERRVVGSLLLLSSLTFLTLGLYTEQLELILEIVKKIFRSCSLSRIDSGRLAAYLGMWLGGPRRRRTLKRR